MASIAKTFAITAIALGALTGGARPVHSEAPIQITTDAGEPEEEAVFHRLEALEAKRLTFPKSISTREWQTAFCGWGDDVPRPQYLGTLFADYRKADRKNKSLTIQWVEALADELVQRGDAAMFLQLASHYVKYNEPVTSSYSSFYGQPNTFGLELSRLGNLLKASLKKLSPADQKLFKKDLGEAAASYLAVDHEPQQGFITATLGVELMTQYTDGDEALAAFEAVVKTATFEAADLQGFFTFEGTRDFMIVASGFMPNITAQHSPLVHLFNMALRVDKEAGESMRNMFIGNIEFNTPDETLFAIDYVYRVAAQQRYTGKDDTLAQQMLSPAWQQAVSDIMTPKMIRAIYLQYYTGTKIEAPQTFTLAHKKQFSGLQETEMQGVYRDLLKATAKNPRAYYNMINDLLHDDTFKTTVAKEHANIVVPHILSHLSYLAAIYMEDYAVGSTIDSNIRMMHLMRLDATLPSGSRVTTAGFQRAISQLAKSAKHSPEQSYQLVKLLATVNNTGWGKHITPAFIEALRKNLAILRGSFAEETLDGILRVQADERARVKQQQVHTQVNRNAR